MKWETFLSKANQQNSKLTNQEMSSYFSHLIFHFKYVLAIFLETHRSFSMKDF